MKEKTKHKIIESKDKNNNGWLCLVQFVNETNPGIFTSGDWPAHVTLAGVFSADPEDIRGGIEQIARGVEPFTSTIIGHDSFGYGEKWTDVALVGKSSNLAELHQKLVDELRNGGAEFRQPTFLENEFNPHVSRSRHLGLLALDSTVRFDGLSLVDMAPKGNKSYRQIIWQAALGSRQN